LQNILFEISPETHFRLRKLKIRIEKGKKEKISFDQLFEIMLDIIENKERIVRKMNRPGIAPLVTLKNSMEPAPLSKLSIQNNPLAIQR